MNKNNFDHLVKKMKKHEREVLLPLYHEHSTYLLRVIKTLDKLYTSFDINSFKQEIPTFLKVATCHEIAINNSNDEVVLQTHQNKRGKEFEYSTHPKSKKVSRDLRVRIIWQIIHNELDKDISLSNYKIYDDLDSGGQHVICPQCQETVGEINNNEYIHYYYNMCDCISINDSTGEFNHEYLNKITFMSEKLIEKIIKKYGILDLNENWILSKKGSDIVVALYTHVANTQTCYSCDKVLKNCECII